MRLQQGEWANIGLLTSSRGVATAPASAPSIAIYTQAGSKVYSALMPAVDLFGATGVFSTRLFLGSTFPVGRYMVAMQFAGKLKVGHFTVTAGGDANGSVIAMFFYQRPQANFLVCRLDSDQRLLARNPRL